MKLRAEGLTKMFGSLRAVNDLSFELDQGQIWGFIGPNGAGKTTTLRMLATVEQPSRGDAFVDGYSVVDHADQVRPLIGFMPDYFGSYPDMLVSEYLDFFARAYRLRGAARSRRIADIVAFVEIGPLLAKRVTALSKGMRQRINLARTLLHDPGLLLLDEPAAGLDPQSRMDLRELLRLLARDKKTIFISSHILAELEDLVDKVIIIHEGELIYSGVPQGDAQSQTGEIILNLKIVGDLQAAARRLLETAHVQDVQRLEPDGLRVSMTGGKNEIAHLVETLVGNGQVPYQVVTSGKALERMFLEITRRRRNGQG